MFDCLSSVLHAAILSEPYFSFKSLSSVLNSRLKEEKRVSKKPQMAKVLSILQRKFPREVEATTKELSADDATALQLIAAANVAGTQGGHSESLCIGIVM